MWVDDFFFSYLKSVLKKQLLSGMNSSSIILSLWNMQYSGLLEHVIPPQSCQDNRSLVVKKVIPLSACSTKIRVGSSKVYHTGLAAPVELEELYHSLQWEQS